MFFYLHELHGVQSFPGESVSCSLLADLTSSSVKLSRGGYVGGGFSSALLHIHSQSRRAQGSKSQNESALDLRIAQRVPAQAVLDTTIASCGQLIQQCYYSTVLGGNNSSSSSNSSNNNNIDSSGHINTARPGRERERERERERRDREKRQRQRVPAKPQVP